MSDEEKNRSAVRRRMLKKAAIAYNDRHITVECQLRDLSDDGARLRPQPGIAVPDHFELLVDLDGMEAPCQVVWRGKRDIGVKFTEKPSTTKPIRLQVITENTSGRKFRLRKERAL